MNKKKYAIKFILIFFCKNKLKYGLSPFSHTSYNFAITKYQYKGYLINNNVFISYK